MSKEVQIEHLPSGKFRLSHNGKFGDQEADYPVLDFSQGSGPQLIVFQLPSGPTRFDSSDPLWVAEIAKPKVSASHDQITDVHVFNNGKTLVALNKNSEDVDLFYNLNLRSGAGNEMQLDPVITNGGGQRLDYAVYAIGAAVIAAFLTVLFVRFAMGWRPIKP